jgi:WD40 repeat protein
MRISVSASVVAVLVLSALSAPPASAHPASGIVVDQQGQVFFQDIAGRTIWKIDAEGKLTKFHQSKGGHWMTLDAAGSFARTQPRFFERITPTGVKPALIYADGGSPLVVHPDGNLYYVSNDARMTPGGLHLTRMSPDGKLSVFSPDLNKTTEKLGITGLATGPDGSLYLACSSAVLKVKMDGTFTKLSHPVVVKDCDVDFPDGNPRFPMPALRGLAVDSRGTVYAAATGCHRVVKITPDGKVETILKAERPWSPTGVAVRGEDIYVLEYTNATKGNDQGWLPRVRKLGRDGTVITLATILPKDQGRSPPRQKAPEPRQPARERAVADEAQPGPLHLVLQYPPVISVNSVAVSPDGSLIATGADGVRLYDARTGALLRAFGDSWDQNGPGGRGVAFSPDGRTLAAAGFHKDKRVGIFDVQTGKRLQSLAGHTEWEIDAIAFSPDGKLLASAGVDKQILVWELATGKLRHRLADQPSRVPALAFSPDSATLAGGGNKTIRLWDVATGRLRRSLEGHRDWVCALAFAPDGKTIASGSCDWAYHRGRDTSGFSPPDPGCHSQWKLWDAATGDLKRTVTEQERLLSLALAPDGKSLACGVGKEVRLYDVRSETSARVVTRHDFAVTSVAFTKDGSAVISGSHDHTVKRTNLATSRTQWQAPGYFEQVNSVALSKDGALLATGSSDGRYAHRALKADAQCLSPGAVRLWDARTGRLLRQLGNPAEQIMAVALSPDGRRLASGGANARGSGVVRVWDTGTGKPAWTGEDHTAEVLAIAYAPDGSSVATAAADGLVKLRDAATGAVRQTLEGHVGGATSLAFSADGDLLACGGGQGATRLWETRTGRLLRTFQAAGSKAATVTKDRLFTSVALSADGATLAACAATVGNTYTEPVRFWDTRSGALKKAITAEAHSARPIALSPDGFILATGGKTIKLWDVRTGKLLRELFGHLKKTQAITFSADGRLLVSGGSYGTTNAWEVATGRHLVTLFTFPASQKGATLDDWLAYTPDGFYNGSPGVERYLAWRVGDDLQTPASLGAQLHRPDRIESALKLNRANPGSP